jgi:hypothetical protein
MKAAGLLLAALAAANVAVTVVAETPAAIVVVKAARLIDGRGGAPLSPAMVRIEGERRASSPTWWPCPAIPSRTSPRSNASAS